MINKYVNKFFNEDSSKLIKKMISDNIKVDHIITDPPYNISRKNNFKTINRHGIEFGEWDKNFDQTFWLKNIEKIIKPGGSVIIFNDWRNLGVIANFLENKNFKVKDIIRWIKPSPMPRNINRRYVTDYEFAIWLVYLDKKWVFNKSNEFKYLRPEFIGAPPMGIKRIHSTQKSSKIISEIISIHTNVNDLVFDPFAGSGEISSQLLKNNRNFIASEIDEIIFQKIKKRGCFDNNNFAQYIRPVYNHLGNKYNLLNYLLNFIDKKLELIEIFGGTGILSVNSCNKKIWINDLHWVSEINKIIYFDYDLNKKLEFLNHKYFKNNLSRKDSYRILRDKFNENKDVYLLLLLVINGFNQQIRFNKNKEFNIPLGKQEFNSHISKKILEIQKNTKRKNIKITSMNFEELINNIIKDKEPNKVILYLDPPYYLSHATYNEEWSEENEIKLYLLLEKLNNLNFKFILSNVIFTKNKVNVILEKFIIKNKFFMYALEKQYKNSNYQRKLYNYDKEVIVTNLKYNENKQI